MKQFFIALAITTSLIMPLVAMEPAERPFKQTLMGMLRDEYQHDPLVTVAVCGIIAVFSTAVVYTNIDGALRDPAVQEYFANLFKR